MALHSLFFGARREYYCRATIDKLFHGTEVVVIKSYVWVSLLTFAMLAGCGSSSGPKTYKVTGTVTMNGKPVEGAVVTFLSTEKQKDAVGSTNAKGEFKLSTFGPGDGALPGSYKITITKLDSPAAPAASTPPPGTIASGEISESYVPPSAGGGGNTKSNAPKNLLPAKYSSDQTSGLVATVAENDRNKFDFEL